jgi:hypothetical protein
MAQGLPSKVDKNQLNKKFTVTFEVPKKVTIKSAVLWLNNV